MSPGESSTGYVFESRIAGYEIPKEYFRPIDEGIRQAAARGVLAGYPIEDVKVELYNGSYHERGLIGDGVQECRNDGVPGGGEEGWTDHAGTDDAGGGRRPARAGR